MKRDQWLMRRVLPLREYDLRDIFELDTMTADLLSNEPQMKEDGLRLWPQLMFNGPSAAIEGTGDMVKLFFNGEPNSNRAFTELVDKYRQSILQEAGRLRSCSSDTVTLLGVWHHVDYDAEPRFEPYITRITPMGGRPSVQAYRSRVFDYDTPGEAMLEPVLFRFETIERLRLEMAGAARSILAPLSRNPGTSGIRRLQGIIWHQIVEGALLPFSVSRIYGLRPGETLPPADVTLDEPSFEESRLIEARQAFAEALTAAESSADLTPVLQTAYDAILEAEGALSAASNSDDPQWVSRCLRQSSFGVLRGCIVKRGAYPGVMSLAEIADATCASGCWFQVRFRDEAPPYEPIFRAFDGDEGMREIWRDIKLHRVDPSEEHKNAAYVSDWERRPNGVATRYLALGDELKLSW